MAGNETSGNNTSETTQIDYAQYAEGGLIGATKECAEKQLKIIKDTFSQNYFPEYYKYAENSSQLENYFGIDQNGIKLTAKHSQLSSIEEEIKSLVYRLDFDSDSDLVSFLQKTSDFIDLLRGYTAAIISKKAIIVEYKEGGFNNFTPNKDGEYDESIGGKVSIDIKYDENGNPMSADDDFSLNELSAHEILGHGVGYNFQVPGHKSVEAIKYEAIIRRLEGREARNWENKTSDPEGEQCIHLTEYSEKVLELKVALTAAEAAFMEVRSRGGDKEEVEKAKKEVERLQKAYSTAVQNDLRACAEMQRISNWNYENALENARARKQDSLALWTDNPHNASASLTKSEMEEILNSVRPAISADSKHWREVLKIMDEKNRQQSVLQMEPLFPPAFRSKAPESLLNFNFSNEEDKARIPRIKIDTPVHIVRNITGNIPASLITRKFVEELLIDLLSRADRTAGNGGIL